MIVPAKLIFLKLIWGRWKLLLIPLGVASFFGAAYRIVSLWMNGSDYRAHGWCLLWSPPLIVTTVGSDALIALAYYSIPILLWRISKRKPGTPGLITPYLSRWFAVFIFLCGTTHIMDIVTIWVPLYWLAAYIKLATGLVSIVTAFLTVPLYMSVSKLVPIEVIAQKNREIEELNLRLSSLQGNK